MKIFRTLVVHAERTHEDRRRALLHDRHVDGVQHLTRYRVHVEELEYARHAYHRVDPNGERLRAGLDATQRLDARQQDRLEVAEGERVLLLQGDTRDLFQCLQYNKLNRFHTNARNDVNDTNQSITGRGRCNIAP